MTNGEKYKNGEEMTKGFVEFCHLKICKNCPIFAQGSEGKISRCLCFWLDREAEEADPAPLWKENIANKFTRKD